MNEEAAPDLDFRFDRDAAKPADFNPAEWTILKRQRETIAARHTSGIERKIPASWMETS